MSSEISDAIEEVTKVKEKRLREEFADSLDKSMSKSAILVHYNQVVNQVGGEEETRSAIGFPYEIISDWLIIGPYAKDIGSMPRDYHQRQMSIPIRMIVSFKKIEL